MQTDKRVDSHRKVIDACPPCTLYGARGQQPAVWMLSYYEFVRCYQAKQAFHPQSASAHERYGCSQRYQADLTEAGLEAMIGGGRDWANLQPGIDYVIREEGGSDWHPTLHPHQAKTRRSVPT